MNLKSKSLQIQIFCKIANGVSYGYGVITEKVFFDNILLTTTNAGFMESSE